MKNSEKEKPLTAAGLVFTVKPYYSPIIITICGSPITH